MKKENRRLPVTLHDHEIEAYGRELGKVLVDKGTLERDRKAINEQIKPLSDRAVVLAEIIDSGIEEREVPCRWEYDWEAGERILYRTDTSEIIENDIIPESERQAHLGSF